MELWILVAVAAGAAVALVAWRLKKPVERADSLPEIVAAKPLASVPPPPKKGPRLQRLTKFLGLKSSEVTGAEWTELEEVLLEGDVGTATTTMVLERLKERTDRKSVV